MSDIKIDPATGIVIEKKVILKSLDNTTDIPTVSSVDTEQRKLTKEQIEEDTEAKKIEMEMEKGYRVITVAPYGEIQLHKPTVKDDYEAELVYAKEIGSLMDSQGLVTLEEMEAKLDKRGTWTKEDKNRLDTIKNEMVSVNTDLFLARSEYKVKKTPDLKRRIKELDKKYAELRTEFFKKESLRSRFMSLTIEGRADERRLVAKMSKCVTYLDGKRIWENPEDLEKERDSESVGRIVFEFITYIQGVDPRILQQVPEILKGLGDKEI